MADNELSAEQLAELDDLTAPRPVKEAKKAKPAEDEPRLHPVLSNEEVEAARAKARKEVEADRKAAATKAYIAEEKLRLQREEGLVTGDGVKDEIVHITLDLAEHSGKITLSGTEYHHGFGYDVPRHVADTLREIQARGHNHQNEIEGKMIADRFRRPHNTSLSPIRGVASSPQLVA